jgi:hypothetical protein
MKRERSLPSPSKKEIIEMQLPNSGRIVVIDDNAKEIQPLLFALGRATVPYIYYDGSKENLPPPGKPPGGVRFLFLDIELHGMAGQSRKTKASGITAILKRIISDSNGPYVIIFWTKHDGTIDAVLENCTTSKIPPVAWINMEKNRWLKSVENGAGEISDSSKDKIDQISEALNEKLKAVDAFRLYIEWENILHSSSKQFIAEFSSLVPAGDKWSRDTSILFYNLYKTFVEKNVSDDQTEQFRCACHLMNLSFLDTLENKTNTELQIPEGFNLKQGAISDETKAKLNSSLFIGTNILERPSTGNIYSVTKKSLLDCLKDSIFKPDQIPDQTKLCCVIITPECDLAQNKTILIAGPRDEKYRMHRVVYGVYFPTSEKRKELNSRVNWNDACYDIGPLWYGKQRLKIVFHSSTLAILPENRFSGTPLFRIKRDLLFDLQSKTANHVNRLGNYQLK